MPTEALVLALSAAVIHAVWNLLLAGARDSQAFAAVVLIVGALVGAPAAVFFWDFHAAVWPFLLATSVLELTYFALLAYAYTRSELSVVYPLARGLAPVLVLAAAVTFTGAGTNARQIGGVLLVGAGILLVRGFRGGRGTLLAVVIACAIATYTIVDKHGVTHASPVAYLELMSVFTGVAYATFIVATRGRRRAPRGGGVEVRNGGRRHLRGVRLRALRAAARVGRLGRRGPGERRPCGDRPRGDRPARAGHGLARGRRRARRGGRRPLECVGIDITPADMRSMRA